MKHEEVKIAMAKRLKRIRHGLCLTQEQMAEKLDLSYRQYRRYECGTSCLSIPLIIKVANLSSWIDINYLTEGYSSMEYYVGAGYQRMPAEKLHLLMDKCRDVLSCENIDKHCVLDIIKELYLYGELHYKDNVIRDKIDFGLLTELYEYLIENRKLKMN